MKLLYKETGKRLYKVSVDIFSREIDVWIMNTGKHVYQIFEKGAPNRLQGKVVKATSYMGAILKYLEMRDKS